MRKSELGDAVILDADTDTVTTEFDDVASMPSDVVSVNVIVRGQRGNVDLVANVIVSGQRENVDLIIIIIIIVFFIATTHG